MGRTVIDVDGTCGPTYLLVFSGNKMFKLNSSQSVSQPDCVILSHSRRLSIIPVNQ